MRHARINQSNHVAQRQLADAKNVTEEEDEGCLSPTNIYIYIKDWSSTKTV